MVTGKQFGTILFHRFQPRVFPGIRKWSLLCLILLSGKSPAQLLTNIGAGITLTSGTTISVKGDVANESGGTISNSGAIDLSGNWTNNAGNNCFGTSAGTVVLNGPNQSIGGSSSTAFNNLSLQGTGTKSLLTNTTVGGAYAGPAGVLELNDVVLDLNGNMITVTNGDPAAITRSSGYIQSETDPASGYSFIQWNINNAPAGSVFEFPFGNATTNSYIPYEFSVTTAGVGPSEGYLRVATYPTDPFQSPNNRPLPLGVNALLNTNGTENADKTVDRYWLIHAGNFTTLPEATMVFSYRNEDFSNGTNVINEANLQAQHLNGNTWSYPMMGWDTPSANTVTLSNVTQFDTVWVLVDNTAPLPVTLLAFDAMLRKDETVLCSWATASEINNDYFQVQRSKTGIDFEIIGTVDGAGNSTSLLNYSFTDVHPIRGLSYYRLKQVDFDGKVSYSDIRAVMIGMTGIQYVAYPNPANSTLNLMFSGKADVDGTVQLLNALGEAVLQQPLSVRNAEQLVQLDLSRLAPGNYLLQILSEQGLEQKRIIVSR